MDLNPLYELRDRLRAAAVAGTGLVGEDFRLRRAVEALAPLEAAAPVFARLGQLARGLLDPECPDRAGALLDALTLADAVLTTQAAVAAPEPPGPLALTGAGRAVTDAPYSVLAPLLDALTNSGGGRYGFVVDTRRDRPELFRDCRVRPALVGALGASYAELADRAEEWLCQEGPDLLPLLEQGFDPKGKKDMVRRVRVMEAVAGAEAVPFFLEQLPEAEKEVRAALIHGLRLDPGGADRLLEACRTERGACRKAAHHALARLEAPQAQEYWEKLAGKRSGQAAEYLVLSTTAQASGLVARLLGRWLEPYEAAPGAPMGREEEGALQALLFALPGKSGPAVCDGYRRMAALGTALDFKGYDGPNGQKRAVRFQSHEYSSGRDYLPFSAAAAMTLRRAILFHPTPDLLALPAELEQTSPGAYVAPALTAALLAPDAGAAFDLAAPLLRPAGVFSKKPRKADLAALKAALDGLYWDEERGEIAYVLRLADPGAGRDVTVTRPLGHRPDRRWYDALTALAGCEEADDLLDRLLCPDDPELCALVGRHFYRRALVADNSRRYLAWLRRCGWGECRGLLEAYCKRRKLDSWQFQALLADLPGTAESVAEEAERVLELIRGKRIAVGSWNDEQARRAVAALRERAASNG